MVRRDSLVDQVALEIAVDIAKACLLFEAELDICGVEVLKLGQVLGVLARVVPQKLETVFLPLAHVDQFVSQQIGTVGLVAPYEDDSTRSDRVGTECVEGHFDNAHLVVTPRLPVERKERPDRDSDNYDHPDQNTSHAASLGWLSCDEIRGSWVGLRSAGSGRGMAMGDAVDIEFTGSVPEFYERFLVPLIFEPYAADLTIRIADLGSRSVLEVACGTGVVTRAMSAGLDADTVITATDLNQPMVDHAASLSTASEVRWRQADVMNLPFEDGSFDVVVCQFGVMFFPDRPAAFAEIRRVLRPGGVFLFNTWDRIETNEFAHVVTEAAATVFPDDPPQFLPRTPHGYFDDGEIRADIVAAGYVGSVSIDGLQVRSRAESCEIPAIAYCQGTPLRSEIESRDPTQLDHVTSTASRAIADRFGETDVDGLISGFVITAQNP